jgi:NAD-dependent dihydropyrimidine dehydrogenase PreA subunit
MESVKTMGEKGYGPQIDYEHCNGCKACYTNCPSDVFGWDEEKKRPTVEYPGECHYCAVCELECLQLAIEVVPPVHARVEYGIE